MINIEVIGRDQGMNVVRLDGIRTKISDEELAHIRETGERFPQKQEPVTPQNAVDQLAMLNERVSVLEKRFTDADAIMEEAAELGEAAVTGADVGELVKRIEALEGFKAAFEAIDKRFAALDERLSKAADPPAAPAAKPNKKS